MEKKLCLLFALKYICSCVESAPNRLDELKFDQLSSEQSYDNKEDLDNLLNTFYDINSSDYVDKNNADNFEPKLNYSGFISKYIGNKEVDTKHNIEELKKLLKLGRLHDEGDFDNNATYEIVQDISGKATGIVGKEDRKYKKGTKTRGFHRVQHKDEYKKDKEFYEDDETNGVIKKIGARGRMAEVSAGASQRKYRFHNDRDKELIGKQSYLDRGNTDKQYKESIDSQGFDSYFDASQ